MIQQLIGTLLIEGKAALFSEVKGEIQKAAEEMTEYQNDRTNDADTRALCEAKANVLWEMMDTLEAKYDLHIEAIGERYPQPEKSCLDISTDYLQNLGRWTPSA